MRLLFKSVLYTAVAAGAFIGGVALWIGGEDKPTPSDLIVVLSGAYSRSFYAATLYSQGMGPQVWVSQPKVERVQTMIEELGILDPREPLIHTAILAKRGVPVSKIKLYGPEVDSTVDEAMALRRELGDTTKKLLVVTSAYHVRRSRLILRHYLPHAILRVVATPYEDGERWTWWRHKPLAQSATLEPFKLANYLAHWATGSLPIVADAPVRERRSTTEPPDAGAGSGVGAVPRVPSPKPSPAAP